MTTETTLPPREDAIKDDLFRAFGERLSAETLATDIAFGDIRYIVDAIFHELRQKRVVVTSFATLEGASA